MCCMSHQCQAVQRVCANCMWQMRKSQTSCMQMARTQTQDLDRGECRLFLQLFLPVAQDPFPACCHCDKNNRNPPLAPPAPPAAPAHKPTFFPWLPSSFSTIHLRHFIAVVSPTMQCKMPQPPTSDRVMHRCATFLYPADLRCLRDNLDLR